jgi:hypothetical protein
MNNTLPNYDKPIIKESAIRKIAKHYGRRVSKEFLNQLNQFVLSKVRDACITHNGSKKTLDAAVAGFNGIVPR